MALKLRSFWGDVVQKCEQNEPTEEAQQPWQLQASSRTDIILGQEGRVQEVATPRGVDVWEK